MRGWRRPALAWLALAVYLLPASAFAQATKAGVVTTLEGNVTAVRAVASQPVVLKFKDDVYLQDRVVTGEQSFARLLLGGKAVISIRERSAVTITEVPGRSTIDIESGKIALSVARDRMQPGEVINIKTPNAVAGVRGTVVVAQVTYSLVGGAQQAVSNLWVLRGVIEAVHTDAAGAAIGAPVPVGAMQSFSATPTSSSTGTFTLPQMSGIVQGLQAKGAPDPGTASQAPARLEAVNSAVALLSALTGSPAMQQLATGTSPVITTPTETTPEQRVTEVADIISSPIVPSVPDLQLPQPPPANMTTLPSGQNLLVFTGNQVQSSDGTPIVPTTDPLLSRTGFTIMQQGPDDLIVARSDANVSLPGPLLKLTDTSVQAGDAFLSVAGHVTSTSPQPFIDLDPTMVMAPGNLVEVVGPNGALGLAGTLVKDTGGTVNVGESVVSVSQGGTLASTGQGPLVQLSGTTMTASSLLSVVGSGSSATLGGTLLSTQGGSLNASTSPDALIQLTGFTGEAALQLGGLDPFIISGNQTRTGRVLSVVSSASSGTVGDAALVSLAGPLLSAVSAPIQLTGDVVGVFNGAKVDSTSTLPFIQLSGETTAVVAGATDPGSGTVVDGRLVFVSGIGGPDGVTPATLTLSGPVLRAEAGSIIDTNSKGLSLFTDGALVTRASPVGTSYPLLQVDASSLSVGGTSRTGRLFEITGAGPLQADPNTNPVTGGPSGLQFGQQRPLQHNGRGALLEASNGAFVNIRGANGMVLRLDTALLDATAPIFLLTGTGTRLQTSGNGIELANNARLQTSTNDALVRIDSQARMDVLAGHLVSVSASRLNVAGDLVRMSSNTLLNVTNGVLLSALNGGIVNINGAFVSFTGVGGLINVTNNLAPTAFIAGIPVNVGPGGNIAIGAGALAGLNVNNNIIRINGTALPANATASSGITGSLISVGANGTVKVVGGAN